MVYIPGAVKVTVAGLLAVVIPCQFPTGIPSAPRVVDVHPVEGVME
jgi:hypothetical protein